MVCRCATQVRCSAYNVRCQLVEGSLAREEWRPTIERTFDPAEAIKKIEMCVDKCKCSLRISPRGTHMRRRLFSGAQAECHLVKNHFYIDTAFAKGSTPYCGMGLIRNFWGLVGILPQCG